MTLRPCGPSDLMFQPRRARLDLHTSKKRFFEAQGKGLRTPTFTQGLLLFHTRMPLHIQAIAQRQVYEQKAFAHRALDRRCFYTKLSLHIIACSYTQISFRATTHLNNSHSTRRHVEAQEGPGSSYTYKPVRVECFFFNTIFLRNYRRCYTQKQMVPFALCCVARFITERAFWVVHSAVGSARQPPTRQQGTAQWRN